MDKNVDFQSLTLLIENVRGLLEARMKEFPRADPEWWRIRFAYDQLNGLVAASRRVLEDVPAFASLVEGVLRGIYRGWSDAPVGFDATGGDTPLRRNMRELFAAAQRVSSGGGR